MMRKIIKDNGKAVIIWTVAIALLLVTFTGCKARGKKIFTIGIINDVSILSSAIDGFKAGMTELGYVEGQNIKYNYDGLLESNDNIIDDEIKHFLSLNVDMILTVGNQAALRAKKVVGGGDIPVVVSACGHRLIEDGLLKNMAHQVSNMTGVTATYGTPKALEWLKIVIPSAKKIYLPYNPDDVVSIDYLSGLDKVASQLGIELVFKKVHSVEEAVAAIENLPKDINAIFRIPSPTLDTRNSELSQAAIKKGIPMGANQPLDEAVLINFSANIYDIGKQAARLAHQIHQGVRPADLPFEAGEVFLTINLKTAKKIGIHIPDSVLVRAKTIIR